MENATAGLTTSVITASGPLRKDGLTPVRGQSSAGPRKESGDGGSVRTKRRGVHNNGQHVFQAHFLQSQ